MKITKMVPVKKFQSSFLTWKKIATIFRGSLVKKNKRGREVGGGGSKSSITREKWLHSMENKHENKF